MPFGSRPTVPKFYMQCEYIADSGRVEWNEKTREDTQALSGIFLFSINMNWVIHEKYLRNSTSLNRLCGHYSSMCNSVCPQFLFLIDLMILTCPSCVTITMAMFQIHIRPQLKYDILNQAQTIHEFAFMYITCVRGRNPKWNHQSKSPRQGMCVWVTSHSLFHSKNRPILLSNCLFFRLSEIIRVSACEDWIAKFIDLTWSQLTTLFSFFANVLSHLLVTFTSHGSRGLIATQCSSIGWEDSKIPQS